MAEEDAFWCLVYIIEHLMPAEYYSRDKQLIGAQVDQVFNVHHFFSSSRLGSMTSDTDTDTAGLIEG